MKINQKQNKKGIEARRICAGECCWIDVGDSDTFALCIKMDAQNALDLFCAHGDELKNNAFFLCLDDGTISEIGKEERVRPVDAEVFVDGFI